VSGRSVSRKFLAVKKRKSIELAARCNGDEFIENTPAGHAPGRRVAGRANGVDEKE
jgi:hypothetical protein